MIKPFTILYVGPLWEGSTCLQRMNALKELGHRIYGVDTEPPSVRSLQGRLPFRIRTKLFRLGWNTISHPDLAGVNRTIVKSFEEKGFDILWLDKGLTIEAATLRQIKQIRPETLIVGYSPDDMYRRHNQSKQFLEHLSLYDLFFTTKSYNVAELTSLGCKRVVFVGNAFDPKTHYPRQISAQDKAKLGAHVGFVGSFEEERARSMGYLAEKGLRVRVWGAGWERSKYRHKNLVLEGKGLWGDDYAMAICAFDINLCFLRKINRDLQTTRSVEIPACGGFMLAERTEEHLDLFEEGKEAEFFESDEELLDKTRYYLRNEEERRRIARAGYERCLKSGYSNHARVERMIEKIGELR